MKIIWSNLEGLHSHKYVCGYCSSSIAVNQGYNGRIENSSKYSSIYICHHCHQPTYFPVVGAGQFPGVAFGSPVAHIPHKDVEELYNEARQAISVNAFTGSVLCSRKLLMNIAVSKGADTNLKFAEYVNFLADKGYVPPNGTDWVDHIRTKGNEATHEIAIMTREDAEDLITFVEALLIFIYEYPGMMAAKKEA